MFRAKISLPKALVLLLYIVSLLSTAPLQANESAIVLKVVDGDTLKDPIPRQKGKHPPNRYRYP